MQGTRFPLSAHLTIVPLPDGMGVGPLLEFSIQQLQVLHYAIPIRPFLSPFMLDIDNLRGKETDVTSPNDRLILESRSLTFPDVGAGVAGWSCLLVRGFQEHHFY